MAKISVLQNRILGFFRIITGERENLVGNIVELEFLSWKVRHEIRKNEVEKSIRVWSIGSCGQVYDRET